MMIVIYQLRVKPNVIFQFSNQIINFSINYHIFPPFFRFKRSEAATIAEMLNVNSAIFH